MKLHRLTLTNYRGIAHREVEFADAGVTVVCGANEVGKSSMIEALDLLLEAKDRSVKKDVKQVKPTHADVGAEVCAEISTGPYRFVYRKRFHKKAETELTVLAPAREQLTGDEAHERVRAMLDETVDTGLWQAQRVLQASSTSAVDLAGSDALSRALDVAASDAPGDLTAGLSGTEPLLIDKIDTEYARYFTSTGRVTGEWAAAINALKDADAEVATCAAAVAEVEQRVNRHHELTAALAELSARRAPVEQRHRAARAAAEEVAALTEQLRAAQSDAAAARAAEAAATAAHQERLRLCAELDDRRAAVLAAQSAVTEATETAALDTERVQAAQAAANGSAEALESVRQRVRAARDVVDRLARRAEAQRLAGRIDRVDAAATELDTVTAALAEISMSENLFRRIETATTAVERAQTLVDVAATALEFTAETDLELVVGSDTVALAAGQSWTLAAAEPTVIRVPGQLSVTVTPPATAVQTSADLAAAQQDLADLLREGGVADLTAAREAVQRRRELSARQDQLTATRDGLLGGDDIAELRAQLAELQNELLDVPAATAGLDVATAKAELAAAVEAQEQTVAQAERDRVALAEAEQQQRDRTTAVTVAKARAETAEQELTSVSERLTGLRAEATDEALQQRAEAATLAAGQSAQRVTEVTGELDQRGAAAVTAELTAAGQAAAELQRSHEEATQAVRDIEVEMAVFGAQGRTGKLDAARIRREHAAAEHARVQRRARAVQLLRSVMMRHRDDTRLRYVEPFRTEVQRLGRTVFGPTFEVEVDSQLCIVNRTLDGRTVPFESLSGGAREQLGIIARLAVSALVAEEDSVPVMIDDALGFSDPDRLAKMAAVFEQVGDDGQVIVLTCSPERYRDVAGAHRIQLSA